MRILIVAALPLTLAANEATAQSRPASLFVEGAFLADHQYTRFAETGTKTGGGATIGVMLSPLYSLRFDMEIPDWSATEYGYDGPIGDQREVSSTHREDRTNTYTVLFGRHYQPRHALILTIAGGLTRTAQQDSISGFTDRRTKDGTLLKHTAYDEHSTYYSDAFTLGLDAEILVTPRLAIVPELRVHGRPQIGDGSFPLISRPRIAVRWRF